MSDDDAWKASLNAILNDAFGIDWGGPPTKAQWEWQRAADEVGERYTAAMRETRREYKEATDRIEREWGFWEKLFRGPFPPASRYQLLQAEREIAELRAKVKYGEELRALRDPDAK